MSSTSPHSRDFGFHGEPASAIVRNANSSHDNMSASSGIWDRNVIAFESSGLMQLLSPRINLLHQASPSSASATVVAALRLRVTLRALASTRMVSSGPRDARKSSIPLIDSGTSGHL